MSEMKLADGTILNEPAIVGRHAHSWPWARVGTGSCSVIEREVQSRDGCVTRLLSGYAEDTAAQPILASFLLAIVAHRMSEGWTLVMVANDTAMLRRMSHEV